MVVLSICIIIAGLLLDIADFILRAKSAIKREKVPSAVPLVGFLMVTIGLVGLRAFSDCISISKLIILVLVAFFFEIIMQTVIPLLFTIVCNLIYGRKLLDMSPLPEKKR